MNFKDYIAMHRPRIYSKITEYIPIKEPAEHYAIVRDYIDRQGSYRRPGLLMLSGQLFGAQVDELVLPAAAMQLSEDWILMHDDVEDDSDLRRGKPALHKLYGNAQAINAGDAAHIIMWKIINDYVESVGFKKGKPIYEKFYDLLKRTVEGQHIEIKFMDNTRTISKASEKLYFSIIGYKTCYYTVYGPLQLGAIVAGADSTVLPILKEIGYPAGAAFQIVDDILDMTADEKEFGKKRYGDLYEGKITLIILHTYNLATRAEKNKIDRIYKKDRKDKTETEINFLIDTIKKYEGIEYATSVAEKQWKYSTEAVSKYRKKLPDNQYTEIMLSAINDLFNRNK